MHEPNLIVIGDRHVHLSLFSTERNPAQIYLASLAPTGRRTMIAKLANAARLMGCDAPRTLDWAALRFEHVSALRSRLLELNYAPATINATMSGIRGVARVAWSLGQMPAEDFQRIASVKNVRGSRLPAGRALSAGEVGALLDTCSRDATPAGARDAAMLAMLVAAGLRRSEAASLCVADYDPESGVLRVTGKGNKQRLTYLEGGAAAAVADWLHMRGNSEGALLCPISKSGEITIRLMSAQSIYNALLKRGREASVPAFSPHDLRRSFVSNLLDAGADISAVQKLVGHSNIETTARYDRRGETAKKKAASLLHLPYHPRQR